MEGLPVLYDSDIAYFNDNEGIAYTIDGEAYRYNEFIYKQGNREEDEE